MRQRTAVLGDEGRHLLLRQQDDVGRGDVVGNDDEGFAAVALAGSCVRT